MAVGILNKKVKSMSIGDKPISQATIGESRVCGRGGGGSENPMIELTVDMTEDQTIDLSSALYRDNKGVNDGTVSDTVSYVIIDWGDSLQLDRTNCSDKAILTHTYKKPKKYTIRLYGTIDWFSSCSVLHYPTESDHCLSRYLTEINVSVKSPIRHVSSLGMQADDGMHYLWMFGFSKNLTKVTGDILSGLEETDTNKSILVGVFYHCPNLTITPITKLPPMKRYMPKGYFNTTGITEIPPDMFKTCPEQVTRYMVADCFYNTHITSIPENLFDPIPEAEQDYRFDATFASCQQLASIPSNIVKNVPNSSNVYLNEMFANCTGITGELPKLWETHPNTQHEGCFAGCVNASNYSEVPDDWKTEPADGFTTFSTFQKLIDL